MASYAHNNRIAFSTFAFFPLGSSSVTDSFDYVSERGFVVQVEAKSESSSQVALIWHRLEWPLKMMMVRPPS